MSATNAPRTPQKPMFRVLFGAGTRWFALAVLTLSFVLPPTGLGVDLCWFHRTIALPCPGCGLTRAMIALSHGHLVEAVRLHVMSPVIYALLWTTAGLQLAGPGPRARFEAWMAAREGRFRASYRVGIALFLVFGGVRLASGALDLSLVPIP